MALLTVTINNASPSFDRKSQEVTFIQYALDELKKELGRGQGTVTSGTIVGTSNAGVAGTALGTWTYTPVGSLP